jgi:Ankyrin repeats (3 copies)
MSFFIAVESNVLEPPEWVKMSNQLPNPQNFDLFNAAAAGDVRLVDIALLNGGKPNFFNVSQEQKTSLHIAAENGHAEVVALLLKNGASIDSIISSSKVNNKALITDWTRSKCGCLVAGNSLSKSMTMMNVNDFTLRSLLQRQQHLFLPLRRTIQR